MKLSVLGIAIFLLTGPVVVADELDDAYQSLQNAVTKKDAPQVKKLAVQVCELARKVIASPEPTNAIEKEDWPNRLKYTKEAEAYTEYALYATAVQSDSAAMVDLLGTLEQQSPKSKYLDDGYAAYLAALHQVGKDDAIPAIAEKAIVNFPNNPDLLLVMATSAQAKKQSDRAISFANRLVAAANARQKPEAESAADWERQKGVWLGRGYWIAGVTNGERNLYALSNKSLRAALPYIKGEPALMGPALFYLGVDNYQLGVMTNNKKQVLEGASFSEESAAIPGQFQGLAARNAQSIKATADQMR
jgi:tetratricopeptide (TPR) repeat protein